MFRTIIQSVGMFLLVQFAIKQFTGGGIGNSASTSTSTGGSSAGPAAIPAFENRPLSRDPDVKVHQIPEKIAPIWASGIPLDLSIYLAPSPIFVPLAQFPKGSLAIEEKAFGFGNWKDKREIDTTFAVPREVQNNATLWAHFFIGHSGAVLDPSSSKYDPSKAYYFVRPFTQYLPKKKVHKKRNLLSTADETEEGLNPGTPGPAIASYYHPNFTLSFVPDSGVHQYGGMHPAVRSFVTLEQTGARDASGQNGWYYPILYVNTFWQLRNHMTEINDTVKELPLHISLNNAAQWQFSIFSSLDEGMKINAQKAAQGEQVGPGSDGAEFEEFKRILLDSNSYLLATTFVVSILHMIFEALAFKSDVQHWRKKKDNVGTSLRSILANVVMQAIIFLYLLDNNEHTSWMIIFSQGMGIAIEAWKVTKTVNVRIRPAAPGALIPYTIAFEDKHKLSDTEKKTQEYDEIAFKYLYIVAIPLLLAYAAYSLVYDSHKSWYSFVIATLVGSVYAYGFLMMVPSLYINYRLKSVAHMPARAMMYKFLNTFIDDLFAFTIKMPMLHRLATLRDDVIFFVYLYQSWKYKIDYSRVNEFGQGGGEDDEKEAKKEEEEEKEEEEKTDDTKALPDSSASVKASGVETTSTKAKSRK
jgi:hypothetical protein